MMKLYIISMNSNEKIDQNIKTFGERLKQLRLEKGLSQTEIGNLTKTHYTQIGRYERGISVPSSDTLKLLANTFNVSTDFLYEGDLKEVASANIRDKELLAIFEQAEKLSDKDKELVKEFLQAFLMKKNLQEQFGLKAP